LYVIKTLLKATGFKPYGEIDLKLDQSQASTLSQHREGLLHLWLEVVGETK